MTCQLDKKTRKDYEVITKSRVDNKLNTSITVITKPNAPRYVDTRDSVTGRSIKGSVPEERERVKGGVLTTTFSFIGTYKAHLHKGYRSSDGARAPSRDYLRLRFQSRPSSGRDRPGRILLKRNNKIFNFGIVVYQYQNISSSSSSSLDLQPVAMTERDKSRYTEGSVNIGGSVDSILD
ncbi:hypothetical protein EVAR_16160_1 [Eumeta japonica]|uniref:Uncharacterized protein n=1 Tax=Eumeta variegata TaxID=151549 RepID=A0A4C1WBQ6_EUMVA|nr:hypothetical protein EVAR_16160_1 [Eumeta japonica]